MVCLVFIQDFGICCHWVYRRWQASCHRAPLRPPRPLPTLTHIGALNRWQARQDYLGPLPGKTIGTWVRGGGACAPARNSPSQRAHVYMHRCCSL